MVTINGKPDKAAKGKTVAQMLALKEFRMALVAVEYNGKILKKDEYDKTVLQSGDVVEVVSFMGGG